MPEGTTPLFTNWRTGAQMTIPSAIPDNSLSGAKLVDGSVTNVKLADMAQKLIKARKTLSTGAPEDVSLSDVLDFIGAVAQGAILFRDATGWNFLPAGTSGQFLQTQGAGANPQWQGGGGISTIASGSLSGNSVPITNIPQTYAHLSLQVTGGSFDTAARRPLVQISTNNGSTYDSVVANYPGDYWFDSGATYQATTLASLAQAQNVALAATTFTFNVTLFNYQAGPRKISLFEYEDSAGASDSRGRIFYKGSTNGVNALQIINSGTGNFDAGTYALYGIS